jgi:hypothetical protein
MKIPIDLIAAIIAFILIGFAVYFVTVKGHDYVFATYLLVWALIAVWVGGFIQSKLK